ncbi:uncharacterized protein DFL_005427 [Arthrobotrys flagrans]|uniref:Uncharacterized protein n=1 Tax=Arthrobotrys flagrans TaxID=97331 RepID=A0A436ZXB9_ARTFL|nr:hypothetical protein DFL_005427 [Arthrobotrys flagrans]
MASQSRSALAPHHAAIKAQILRLLGPSSPDDLRRFLEEISIQQDVLENISDLWPDLPLAYDAEREELADDRKEVYILYDAALDDREKIRRRWERLLGKHRWGRHEVEELKKCREYMARNAVKMVGLCVEYAEFSSQIQGFACPEDDLRVKLEKLYVDENLSTASKLRRMRNILNMFAESRPKAERYTYRRRSLSPDDDEEEYWTVPKPEIIEPSRDSTFVEISYTKPHRSRADRHEHKRHRRGRENEEREERDYIPDYSYEVGIQDFDERPLHNVYSNDSSRHAFRSSSHDTSFLWRSTRTQKEDDHAKPHYSGRHFSLSYTNLPPPEEPRRSSAGGKHHRPSRYEDDEEPRRQKSGGRYLEVPKPKPAKQYTSWEVYEIV